MWACLSGRISRKSALQLFHMGFIAASWLLQIRSWKDTRALPERQNFSKVSAVAISYGIHSSELTFEKLQLEGHTGVPER